MGQKRLALVLPLFLTLAACTTSADSCAGFKPIRPTVTDLNAISQFLNDQLVVHNETGQKLCKWKP